MEETLEYGEPRARSVGHLRSLLFAAGLFLALTACSSAGSDPAESVESGPEAGSAGLWMRVTHDEAVFGGSEGQSMTSVTSGGPGLVAVGWDGGSLVGGSAAVWTSTDGLVWSRVPHDEAVFGGSESQSMTSVTTGGPGLVAVGWDGGSLVRGSAAVWTSTDGLIWSRVPHDEMVFGGGGEQSMTSVTSGGPGLVAVGWDGSLVGGRAAVWT
jgi:hypothetical protein